MIRLRSPKVARLRTAVLGCRTAARGIAVCTLILLAAAPGPTVPGPTFPQNEQKLAASRPSETEVFSRGCALLLSASYDAAAEAFREGMKSYPRSERLQLGLGIALYASDADDQARDALLKARDLEPGDTRPQQLLDSLAQHRGVRRDADQRRGEIRQLVTMIQAPASGAMPAKSAGKAVDTGIDYSDSAALRPGAISGSVDAGGYSSQAQSRGSELRQALGAVTPQSTVVENAAGGEAEPSMFQRANALLLGGDYSQAAEAFGQGAAQFPQSARMELGLGVADYSRGLYEEAIDALCRAADLSSGSPQAYFFLVQAYSASPAKTAEVLKRLAAYASSHPEAAPAQYDYAVALWRSRATAGRAPDMASDNAEQVERLLQSAIALDPSLAEAHFQLGAVLADQGDIGRAAREFERAVALEPQWAEAHYRLGQTYRRMGENGKAQGELEQSERLRTSGDSEDRRIRAEIRRLMPG
jgi:TolA-binding protein